MSQTLIEQLAGTVPEARALRMNDPNFKAYCFAVAQAIVASQIQPKSSTAPRSAQTHAAAKIVTVNPGSGDNRTSIQGAINGLSFGDTLLFAPGVYKVGGQLAMKPGIQLRCDTKRGAFLDFTVPKDPGTLNGANYAFRGDMSDTTFDGLEIRSNNGVFSGQLTRARFINNGFEHGGNGNYYNRLVWYCGGDANGLVIERNHFHDSPNSDRTLEIWNWAEGSYSFNTFDTVNDGGHIMNPGHGMKIKGNRFKKLRRMSIEVQQDRYPPSVWSERFVFQDNVIESRRLPYWDSMGASIPLAGIDVTIRNNYIRQIPFDGVWGESDSSGNQRGSYGIEAPQAPAGQPGGIVEGNTIIAERDVMGVACPGKNTIVRNNKLFGGPFGWGRIAGEPGSLGGGNAVETANTHDANVANAPPIPGTTPDPIPTPGPTMNLTATAFKTYVDLTLDFTGSIGTTALERRASDNVWLVLATWPAGQTDTSKPYKDTQFSADQIANKWRFWYRLRDKNGSTPDVVAQIGVNPDPTTPPPGTPTTTEHTLEFPPILVEGQPVKLVRTVQVTANGERTVKAK